MLDLDKLVEGLLSEEIIPNAKYFEFEFEGESWSYKTLYCRHTETKPRRELRQARYVNPEESLWIANKIGKKCYVVNTLNNWIAITVRGGKAVVNATMLENDFPFIYKEILTPQEVFESLWGFHDIASNNVQRNKAPSKKLKEQVLKRDEYQCVLCKASPKENPYVQLHIHHIMPWSQGGATCKENLLTICWLCHKNLKPHESLFLSLKHTELGRKIINS